MNGCVQLLGSARVSRAGNGVPAIANFSEKIVAAGRRNQRASRVRSPEDFSE